MEMWDEIRTPRPCDFAGVVSWVTNIGSPDRCENFQPPLAFRLDINELV